MSLFPILQPALADQDSALPLYHEVGWDFVAGTPRFRKGAPVVVSGKEAVKVWAWKALMTPRFRHEIYTWAFGDELENLMGQAYTQALKKAEAARYVREALEPNPYITQVTEINVDFAEGVLHVSCTVGTIYGEVELRV